MTADRSFFAGAIARDRSLAMPAVVLVTVLAIIPSLILIFQAFRTPDGTGFTRCARPCVRRCAHGGQRR